MIVEGIFKMSGDQDEEEDAVVESSQPHILGGTESIYRQVHGCL
jgi:hypothetical protein